MNTRSKSEQNTIEKINKPVLETKPNTYTFKPPAPHVSTSKGSPLSESGKLEISLDDTLTKAKKIKEIISLFKAEPDVSGATTLELKDSPNSALPSKLSDSLKVNTMALNIVQYAIEAVPFFDGYNIPLGYFTEGCEEARSMLPAETEPQFAKILRSRITGEARRTIQGKNFDTVDSLIKYLKGIYGFIKNASQLQGELGHIYQRDKEDVVTYANRVKLLGKQILEAQRINGNMSSGQKESVEQDMRRCFIRGLKPDIEQRVSRDLSVDETVTDALRIDRELREITELRQGPSGCAGQHLQTTRDRYQNACQLCFKEGHTASSCVRFSRPPQREHIRADLGIPIEICQICKKRGHSADKCHFRVTQARQPINTIQRNVVTCQLCSKVGHDAKSCRASEQNNRTRIFCQWCNRSGHSINDCWKKQNDQRNPRNPEIRTPCPVCNNFGHSARECRSRVNQHGQTGDPFCRYCKEQGHLLEDCQVRMASNKRRQENNQGNSNGSWKPGTRQGPEKTPRPSTSQEIQ